MAYVKKYWWVILVLVAVGYIIFLNGKIKNLDATVQLQAVELSVINDSVAVYKSKSGDLTYKLSSVEVDNGNLKKALAVAGYDFRRLKEKNIKYEDIISTLRAELASSGSGMTVVRDTFYIINTDTIPIAKFDWSNKYLSIDGKIIDKEMTFDYSYKTELDIIQTKSRNGVIVNISMTDPNATITTGRSITVNDPRKWWNRPWVWGLAGLTTGILIAK